MGRKNWALVNQTTNKVGLNDKRVKINKCKLKKIVLGKVRGDCSYILFLSLITSLVPNCYSLFLSISRSPSLLASFLFYTLFSLHLCPPRACQMAGVDTCLISPFHKSLCSSCNYCSSITSTLMRPKS